MSFVDSALLAIVVFVLIPLIYCVVTFRYHSQILSNLEGARRAYAIILFGVSFIMFQVMQSFVVKSIDFIVFGFKDVSIYDFLYEVYDLILESGLIEAWTYLTNYVLPLDLLKHWSPKYTWEFEFVFILLFVLIGVLSYVGSNILKSNNLPRFIGYSVLVVSFALYVLGSCFWLLAANS